MNQYRYLATCPKGLASLLLAEIAGLGGVEAKEGVNGVSFTGPLAVGYRACLHSRLANRVILLLSEFAGSRPEDLYAGMSGIAWQDHLAPSSRFAVDFAGQSAEIRNSHFGALRCKDAIVDSFRERGLDRPDVDTRRPDLRVNVRLHKGKVTVGLDLSGASLHQRGYRKDPGKAPLKENLAAAILMRAGWPDALDRELPLIDPMCGSGTLLIEAAMMATQRAPGLGRERWGFQGWLGHQAEQWRAIEADARSRVIDPPAELELRGYDGDIQAVRRTEASIKTLGLERLIRVRPKALNELVRPSHRAMPEGLLVCNPPWGERLGDPESLGYLYRQLGEALHREFQGWRAAVLTASPELGRRMGLRSHKHYKLHSGALDLQLLLFLLDANNHLAPTDSALPGTSANGREAPDAAAGSPEPLSEGAQMLVNRLRKNQRRLQPWLRDSGTTCYRLYDADMPEYAVAIDVYEGFPHVAEYAPPKTVDPAMAQRRFEEALSAVREVLGVRHDQAIPAKRRERQKGREQYQRLDQQGERVPVQEGGARLLVNLHDYLDTGLFLDHRPLRLRIAAEASGKHFLNLFCYTGTATVHAAVGGAATSTSVDLSNTYLQWFRENLALNGLSERQHRAERADCLEWLARCERQFDLILLDPPSFSNSKSMADSFDVQRDHVRLIDLAMSVLAPNGTLYFSNNRRGFGLDEVLAQRYRIDDISKQSLPPDFSRRPEIHRCWRLEHAGSSEV